MKDDAEWVVHSRFCEQYAASRGKLSQIRIAFQGQEQKGANL